MPLRRTLTGCMGVSCCRSVVSEKGDDSMLQDQEITAMAKLNDSKINNDQFIQTSISDVSLWKKTPKKPCRERSAVIDGVLQKQRADYLEAVLEHGWDVNEMQIYGSKSGKVKRTALHHAVFYRWHEGVNLLLNAGANCNIKSEWLGERDLSIPHHVARDDRRHFGSKSSKHVPLCIAIYKNDVEMVKLLLQHGADLKDGGCAYLMVNLDRLKIQHWLAGWTENSQKENSEVLNELLTNGKTLRRNLNEQLQDLLLKYLVGRQRYPEHLDIIFSHGVHIDPEYKGDTLRHAFLNESPINAIRWLIRHGASCTISLYPMLCLASIVYRMVEDDGFLVGCVRRYKLPVLELLLQVGIKPSESLKGHLRQMELMVEDYLQQGDSGKHDDIVRKTAIIYRNIIYGEESVHEYVRKKLPPIGNKQQMADLKEFSNDNLDVYPEEFEIKDKKRESWEQTLKLISNMLHFLNQPLTLQWHCRVCLRESLVSLCPSVIKKLSVPDLMKSYILCHEL